MSGLPNVMGHGLPQKPQKKNCSEQRRSEMLIMGDAGRLLAGIKRGKCQVHRKSDFGGQNHQPPGAKSKREKKHHN